MCWSKTLPVILPVPTLTFSGPTSGPGGLFGNTSQIKVATNLQGHAIAPIFTANSTPGSYSVVVTATGVAEAAIQLVNNDPNAIPVLTAAGSQQTSKVLNNFATPFKVQLLNEVNQPISNTLITFYAPSSGPAGVFVSTGTLTATATTDVDGYASAPFFQANGTLGKYNVLAAPSLNGFSPAVFALTNQVGDPAKISVVSGNSQAITVTAVYSSLVALVQDAADNPVPDASVTFTAPTGSGPTGSFGGASLVLSATTDSGGKATAAGLKANTVRGNFGVTAAVASVGSSATFTLTNKPASPVSLGFVGGDNQMAVVNTGFTNPLVVIVKDQYGNLEDVGVAVSFGGPTTGAGAIFSNGGMVTTDANGLASTTVRANTTAGGPYNVTASVSGVSGPQNFKLSNKADVLSKLVALSGDGQNVVVNNPFGQPFKVQLTDAFGNSVGAGLTVTFNAPGSGASGLFASTGGPTESVVSLSDGTASPSILVANSQAGSYAVDASATGVTNPVSFNLNNKPDVPASVVVVSGDGQATARGTNFTNPLKVVVRDTYGNPVGAGVAVNFAAPGSGASGLFASNSTNAENVNTQADGTATSSTFKANTKTGSYTVAASVSGVGSPANFILTNKLGNPSSVVIVSGDSQAAVVNTNFATPLKVQVIDGLGNPVGAGYTVKFLSPTSGASGTFASSGTNTEILTTAADGTATASTFTANLVAGSYSVSASVSGGGTINFSLTNKPGAPASITILSGDSQTVVAGSPYPQAFKVKVTDAYNNPVGGGGGGHFPGSRQCRQWQICRQWH